MLASMKSVNVAPSRSRMSMRISRSLQLFISGHIVSGKPSSWQVSRAGS